MQEEVYLACKAKVHSTRRSEQASQRAALPCWKGSHRSEPAGLCGLRKQVPEAKEGPVEQRGHLEGRGGESRTQIFIAP